MNEAPALSIITINLNNAAGLKKTMESVIMQSFKNFEYIVIDGCSADESLEVIQHYESNITCKIIERDNGIYHAMNKGIKNAKGNYILFVNSGDTLINYSILEEVFPCLTGEEIIYGDYKVVAPAKTWIKKYPDDLTFSHFIHDSISHSAAAFIKRTAFKSSLIKYDETLKNVSDWKWYLIGIFKCNYSYKHISKIIGVFDYTGVTAVNSSSAAKEKESVFKTEFKEIYNEISLLVNYKLRFETLQSSKFLQLYFKLKSLIFKKN